MEVAAVAENHLVVLEDISNELQQRCGNFLARNLPTFSAVQEFLKKTNDHFDLDLFKKLSILATVPEGGFVTINSSGPVKQSHPLILGSYFRTSKLENGFPVYKKVVGPQQLYVDTSGFWSVSNVDPDDDVLFHPQSEPTPELPPSSGWEYLVHGHGPRNWEPDSLLTVVVSDQK